jgi:hypothetical protein
VRKGGDARRMGESPPKKRALYKWQSENQKARTTNNQERRVQQIKKLPDT